MTTKTTLNRLKKVESKLRPPAKGASNAPPIALWRQDNATQLCRREFGSDDWVDEQTMLATLPATDNKRHIRLVIVKGCWSELEQHN